MFRLFTQRLLTIITFSNLYIYIYMYIFFNPPSLNQKTIQYSNHCCVSW